MRTHLLFNLALCAAIFGTGCATKKYVAKTVAPIDTRVSSTESKNTDQDKELANHVGKIEGLEKDLGSTKDSLGETEQKATAAGSAAKMADQKADNAQKTAEGARQANSELGRRVDGSNRYKMVKPETVLFATNKWTLQDDAKTKLTEFCQAASGQDRFMIEIQGFTDKTGRPETNEILSQRRAQGVARYLANECKIPLRNMTVLGSGYAQPIGDDKTRDGRSQNRRVEVRLFVPEIGTVAENTAPSR
jgi:outer membrane protein OmpA-like peptidoglycan-associated protein